MQFHSKHNFLCWTLILFGIVSILDSCHSMAVEIEEEANWDATTDSTDPTTEDGTDISTDDTTTTTTMVTTENDVVTTDGTSEIPEATTLEALKPMMTWTETLMVLSNKGSVNVPAERTETKKDEINDAVDKAVEALQNIKRVWDKKKHEPNTKKKKHKVSKPKPIKEDKVNIGIKANQPFNLKANIEKNGKVKQVHHKSKVKSENSPNEYSQQMSFIFSPTKKSDEPEKSDFVRKGAEFLRYAWERFKENKNNE